jgi:hypothetical protein
VGNNKKIGMSTRNNKMTTNNNKGVKKRNSKTPRALVWI